MRAVHVFWLSLLLIAGPARAAGTIPFGSGPDWTASAMNADGTIGPVLGPASCYFMPVVFDTNQIPGACCIWLPGWTENTPADMQGAFFSKTIFVPGAPVSGSISVAVDDWVEITVNGSVVATRGSITNVSIAAAAQAPLVAYDLTPYLVSGENSIRVWARNGPSWFAGNCAPCPWRLNGAWVFFGGSITYDYATPAVRGSWGSLKSIYR